MIQLNKNVIGQASWKSDGQLVVAANTLTYRAADVLTQAMARNGPFQITHLYLRFEGDAAAPLRSDGDLRSAVRDDFLETGTGRGGFFVPLLTVPSVDSSDTDDYEGNRLTYYARIPSNVTEEANGLTGNLIVSSSKISAMGLAVAAKSTDRTKDIIFSAMQGAGSGGSFVPFLLIDNGQKFVDYQVAFQF